MGGEGTVGILFLCAGNWLFLCIALLFRVRGRQQSTGAAHLSLFPSDSKVEWILHAGSRLLSLLCMVTWPTLVSRLPFSKKNLTSSSS